MNPFKSKQHKLNDKLKNACKSGDLEIAIQALEDGADIKSENFLFIAALHNRIDVAKLLIAKGADLNRQSRAYHPSSTPLMIACYKGHDSMVELLASTEGVNVNAVGGLGFIALQEAVDHTTSETMVKALLDAGGDTQHRNDDGDTAEEIAVKRRKMGLALLIRNAGKATPKPQKQEPAIEPAQPTNGWERTDVEEISLVSNKPAIGCIITDVFNFAQERHIQIIKDTASEGISHTSEAFSECTDIALMREAFQQLEAKGVTVKKPAALMPGMNL